MMIETCEKTNIPCKKCTHWSVNQTIFLVLAVLLMIWGMVFNYCEWTTSICEVLMSSIIPAVIVLALSLLAKRFSVERLLGTYPLQVVLVTVLAEVSISLWLPDKSIGDRALLGAVAPMVAFPFVVYAFQQQKKSGLIWCIPALLGFIFIGGYFPSAFAYFATCIIFAVLIVVAILSGWFGGKKVSEFLFLFLALVFAVGALALADTLFTHVWLLIDDMASGIPASTLDAPPELAYIYQPFAAVLQDFGWPALAATLALVGGMLVFGVQIALNKRGLSRYLSLSSITLFAFFIVQQLLSSFHPVCPSFVTCYPFFATDYFYSAAGAIMVAFVVYPANENCYLPNLAWIARESNLYEDTADGDEYGQLTCRILNLPEYEKQLRMVFFPDNALVELSGNGFENIIKRGNTCSFWRYIGSGEDAAAVFADVKFRDYKDLAIRIAANKDTSLRPLYSIAATMVYDGETADVCILIDDTMEKDMCQVLVITR